MRPNPGADGKGTIRHLGNATVTLRGGHGAVVNTVGQWRAMSNGACPG